MCLIRLHLLSRFSPQLAQFRRSWSSIKMLAFQPRGFVFEPVRMHFNKHSETGFHFFQHYETPLLFSFVRLFFRNFSMSLKGPSLKFLIFWNRTNVKKFQKDPSFKFLGTMRLLKILSFFRNFCKVSKIPLQFFEILQQNRRYEILKRMNEMNKFRLTLGFLKPSTLCPTFVYLKTGVFSLHLFKNFFSNFTRNKTFGEHKGRLGVFVTM